MTRSHPEKVPIGDVVTKSTTWNPTRDAADDEIVYIDLSSVDNATKAVSGAQTLLGRDAPSRARQLVQAGDILVSTVRPNLNGVARVPEELDGATASTGFCILRPRLRKVDPHFLFHWLQSSDFVDDMVKKATGANYPAVSDKIIFQSIIPLPPLDEQRRIAAILENASELRRKRHSAIDRLAQLGQAIFHEMFGDPVANDKDWRRIKLSNGCRNITDGTHETPERTPSGVPFITSKNVRPFEFDLSTLEFVSHATHREIIKRCNPKYGDILYTNIGASVGSAVKNTLDFEFSLKNVALIQPDPTIIVSDYLEYTLNNPRFKYSMLSASAAGGAQKFVTLKALRNALVPVPTIDLQNQFANRIGALQQCKRRMLVQADASSSLFHAVQNSAFQGEL